MHAFELVEKMSNAYLEDKNNDFKYAYLSGMLKGKLGILLNRLKYINPKLYEETLTDWGMK